MTTSMPQRANFIETHQERLRLGIWVAGPPPYGFANVFMDPEPAELNVVRLVFSHVDAGWKTDDIASALNAHGHVPPKGGTWTRYSLRAIIRNRRIYEGTHTRYHGELVRRIRPVESLLEEDYHGDHDNH